MNIKKSDSYTDEELHNLHHNNHEGAFAAYMNQSRHSAHKQRFLYSWLAPGPAGYILECGSSSGKTCVDLSRRSGCRCLGIDFDAQAVEISTRMVKEHFPELEERCTFATGDLETMEFPTDISTILMPDFTEHIPDRVLLKIFRNIRSQFDDVELCIYTPSRSHIFEILKHRNIVLRNPPGHINVKTRKQLVDVLRDTGWEITSSQWNCSSMSYMKPVEQAFGSLPMVGKYFQRRIAIKARPDTRPLPA